MKNKKGWKIMLVIIVVIVAVVGATLTYCMTGCALNNVTTDIVRGDEDTRSLVVYFSRAKAMNVGESTDMNTHASLQLENHQVMGNTEIAAQMIQQQTGADLYAIQVSTSYRTPFLATSLRAWLEKNLNMRPALSHLPDNLDQYDVIYLGFPIWWYQEPMAVDTFLENYDWNGKTIIPFCTSTSSSIDESIRSLQAICPSANILEGLRMQEANENEIQQWLENLNRGG